jgi:3-isopropylmalate/(R)-2-methylmalate dehydratase large subunit
MSEKILARAAGRPECTAGEIVWARVDRAMMDDILGPRVEIAEKLRDFGERIWDPDKVVVIADHYTPPANAAQAEIVKFTRDWAAARGLEHYHEFVGPCHQIMVEKGYVRPGTLVLGTDSHTCTGGALGAFASGVGSTEMLGILVTGETWLRVPETLRVTWEGSLGPGVMAKDLSLSTIGRVGQAGATYQAVEYDGSTIAALPLDERLAISNMAVEMGAKAGLMAPDEKVMAYLAGRGVAAGDCFPVFSDPDAVYRAELTFRAEDLSPQVACPHEVDRVAEVGDLAGRKIDQAYIGSCTGGRLNDLRAAAALLRGRKVKKGVRLLVSPASQEIWRGAAAEGLLSVLAEAGAMILAPTCGACVGLHSGAVGAGEVCLSASNRNFIGRMGSDRAAIYLASPLTVAAGALTGQISDPRDFLRGS